jgi:hypothetical protein
LYEKYKSLFNTIHHQAHNHLEHGTKFGTPQEVIERTAEVVQKIANKEKYDYYGIISDVEQSKIKILEEVIDVRVTFPKAK